MNDNAPLAYNVRDAGKTLGGLSESTVWRMIRAGELVSTKAARGRTVIRREVLVAYLDAQDVIGRAA